MYKQDVGKIISKSYTIMEQEKSELCKYVDVKTVDHAQAHHLCTIHNDLITQYFFHIFP